MASTEAANTPRGEILLALKLGGPLSDAELAGRTGVPEGALADELDRLRREGQVQEGATPDGRVRHRLTTAGEEGACRLLESEHAALGAVIGALLDDFDASNRAFKELLHRWQLRPQGSGVVSNDHSDERYDGRILAELGALVHRAQVWLERLPADRARYPRYRGRLEAAVDRAGRGELDFVAGLGVDSAHAVWWQLHADLLAVASRERGDADA